MGDRDMQALDAYFVAERMRHLEEYREFLRIPSVSALPSHREEVLRAADWVARALQQAGVPTVELLPTQGHPVVYGAWPAEKPGTPTLLLYAHYDTQPADPLDEWTTPPFEPTIRDGRMYARGASDDKGNLLLTLKVVEAFSALRGQLPTGLIFLFEGEEEIGSPNLRAFIQEHKDLLRADAVMSADSVMWAHDAPSLVLGSKGLIALQIDVQGAQSDLHSGLHGGLAPIPSMLSLRYSEVCGRSMGRFGLRGSMMKCDHSVSGNAPRLQRFPLMRPAMLDQSAFLLLWVSQGMGH